MHLSNQEQRHVCRRNEGTLAQVDHGSTVGSASPHEPQVRIKSLITDLTSPDEEGAAARCSSRHDDRRQVNAARCITCLMHLGSRHTSRVEPQR
jgi:hypothetical protein